MATEIAKKPFLKIALDEAERQTAVTMLQEHNLPAADLDDDNCFTYYLMETKLLVLQGSRYLTTVHCCAV